MKSWYCFASHALLFWTIWNESTDGYERLFGKVRSSITLPCTYDIVYNGLTDMCWGQDECSHLSCNHLLVSTKGNQISSVNSKYWLYGDLKKGNVSLTIHNLSLGDSGKYCCRIEIPGIFNDIKIIIHLNVTDDLEIGYTERYKATWSKITTLQAEETTATVGRNKNLGDKDSDEKGVNISADSQSDSGSRKAASVFYHLMNWTKAFDREIHNRSSQADVTVQRAMEFSQHLLGNRSIWKGLDVTERRKVANSFLQVMGNAVISATQRSQKKENIKLSKPTLGLEISFIERHNITGNKTVTLEAKGDTLNVDPYTVLGDKDSATLAFISYSNLDSVIGPELVDDESNVSKNLQPSGFYSRVVTVTKGNRGIQNLSGNVSITFSRIQGKQEGIARGHKVCVAWKSSGEGGNWSPSSCFLVAMNATHTECRCSVLSSFAVLLAQYEITDQLHLSILSWITYFGLSLSLLCLLVSIVTFFGCQAIQNINTTIKAHLCLNLFLAELLFLVASSIDTRTVLCATVAGGLHYLFLAAFFWMCLEAVQLCLMVLNLKVVNFSRTRVIPRRLMYPIGYGCPAVIVIVTAAVNAKGYGTDRICWLNLERGFIWSFLGPLCFILLVNFILLSISLWILKEKISSLNADVSTIKESRVLTFKAMAQFILLGCFWVFGLFQLKEGTIVMSYLFTILNVLQGVFIFCVYCLLNKQIRREYHKLLQRIYSPQKQEMPQSSSYTMNTSNVTILNTVNEPVTKSEIFWMNSQTEEMPKNH